MMHYHLLILYNINRAQDNLSIENIFKAQLLEIVILDT